MLLYHTSDLHNQRGFAQTLNQIRSAQPGVYVDCGDSLRGSQTVYHRHEPIIEELSQARCDMQAMGNREFHYLFECVTKRAAKMPYPLVCSNLIDVHERPLPFSYERRVALNNGRLLRFFALLVPQYPEGSLWEKVLGWRFRDPLTVAQEIAATTAPDEILVLLSHLGLPTDRRVADAVSRIDLILGGHSHDTLHKPEWVNAVPIVHAGAYGSYVSKTELNLDEIRARVAKSELIPLKAAAQ